MDKIKARQTGRLRPAFHLGISTFTSASHVILLHLSSIWPCNPFNHHAWEWWTISVRFPLLPLFSPSLTPYCTPFNSMMSFSPPPFLYFRFFSSFSPSSRGPPSKIKSDPQRSQSDFSCHGNFTWIVLPKPRRNLSSCSHCLNCESLVPVARRSLPVFLSFSPTLSFTLVRSSPISVRNGWQHVSAWTIRKDDIYIEFMYEIFKWIWWVVALSCTLQYLHRSSATLGVIFPSSHLEVNLEAQKNGCWSCEYLGIFCSSGMLSLRVMLLRLVKVLCFGYRTY